MLNVGPARFRNRRHVEAIASGDKLRFGIGELIERPVPAEIGVDLRAVGRLAARTLGVIAISRNPYDMREI